MCIGDNEQYGADMYSETELGVSSLVNETNKHGTIRNGAFASDEVGSRNFLSDLKGQQAAAMQVTEMV